jgi:hypothetical protein
LKPEGLLASGITLVDEIHPDGGLGFQVVGLPNGAIVVRARVENLELVKGKGEAFFVVGPQGTRRLTSALAFWQSTAPTVTVVTQEPPPNDE